MSASFETATVFYVVAIDSSNVTKKFMITKHELEQVIEFGNWSVERQEKMVDVIDEFLDMFELYAKTQCLANIVNTRAYQSDRNPDDILTELLKDGFTGLIDEDFDYGIGVTQALAYKGLDQDSNVFVE